MLLVVLVSLLSLPSFHTLVLSLRHPLVSSISQHLVMKFLALLALVSAAVATPLSLYDNGLQSPLGDFLPTSYPGFDLDLNAPRLVLLEGSDEPVTMTELEKVLIHVPCGLPPKLRALFSLRHHLSSNPRSKRRLRASSSSMCE